ncbi:hypothetical protein [Candidatus Thioglobus sp. NP1]|uniref:hypothetical protein n=1 Tax=Candidatus Thioglobus sp. NP1 TaxID=2508687 RepID=UPI000DED40EF|nr:hypothetical protein [Candidatus Thioglobus sp. NP1]AXE61720.1 hypothetical protein CRN91_03405 [Candidatus Thioglobus sp. NP1]
MKRYFIFIFIFILSYALPVHSISSYKASYDLYGQTDLGNIKFGSAEYELIVANNAYVFTSNAKTDKLWSAIYDYSIIETSIGLIEDNKLIGDYYKTIENQGDSISENYEINIYPNERYAKVNNAIIGNIFTKSTLEKLSDKELILKAIGSGNFTKIEFGGSQGGNPDIPSYAKVLANRKELIGVLLESLWESKSYNIVDTLSVYLHISEDIQKDPNKKSFFYQIVDKKGVTEREFIIDGFETIIIDNNEVETIRVISPKLRLVFNISKDHNFIPIYINKTNGEANFELVLTDYTQ